MNPTLVNALCAHAVATYPRECCGLIVQTAAGFAIRRGVNRALGRHRFDMDLQIVFDARRDRTPIVAIYHSHCDAPARPSAADAALARAWPGLAHVIVAVSAGRAARIFIASSDASAIEPGDFDVREWNDRRVFAASDDPD